MTLGLLFRKKREIFPKKIEGLPADSELTAIADRAHDPRAGKIINECRECQYITGGAPNMFLAMKPNSFKYTKGTARQFSRSDLERPVTREFCGECGTHLITRPAAPIVVVKVGTLDDPSLFGGPQIAIYTCDKQAFHHVPEGLPAFERLPQR